MHTTRKIITALLAAGIVSSATIGSALADFPRQAYGDLSGNEPVSVRQLQIDNQRALDASGAVKKGPSGNSAVADFPRQAYGDLNGNQPVPVRALRANKTSANVPILPFLGDWNGTAKPGFPHQ